MRNLVTGKRMIAAMVCGLVLSAAPVFAQETQVPAPTTQGDPAAPMGEHHGRGHKEEHRVEHLTKALNLTPDQVTQVRAIDMSAHEQMKAVHTDETVQPADRQAKMMAIRDDSNAKVRAMLNDEQRTKFDTMQAKMKERMNERHGQEGATQPPAAQ